RRQRPVHCVANRRERGKRYEGDAAAIAVGDPAARVLIDAIEEILGSPKGTDRGDRRAERLEIRREEPAPQILTAAKEEHARRHGDDLRREPEELDRMVAPTPRSRDARPARRYRVTIRQPHARLSQIVRQSPRAIARSYATAAAATS